MGKREFKVAQPDGEFLTFRLDAQVSHVYLCPDCHFVVAVFFPYRAAGHGVGAIIQYTEDGVVVTDVYLTEMIEGRAYKCARCSWPYVQAETIREPI